MRLSTIFFSLAAFFVAVSATSGFSVNNRGELVSRQDCCEDPPGCGCPDTSNDLAEAERNCNKAEINTLGCDNFSAPLIFKGEREEVDNELQVDPDTKSSKEERERHQQRRVKIVPTQRKNVWAKNPLARAIPQPCHKDVQRKSKGDGRTQERTKAKDEFSCGLMLINYVFWGGYHEEDEPGKP
ncbi:hypothetical protein C8F04DRAFT_1237015 [Mycena alexandri]|uniref:Uncharacterized protein n=1 Tax=Mycena alexandri TaxID=1745969 RepID=A0AAD6WXZ6_9AGAR|nr:hypothetical protein C8F04DRAFT_1237015 [Mycena alexandri]